MLNETSSRQYHVAEGETVLKNDYFLVTPLQESEFSHLYQLSAVSSVGSASATVQITDVFTGDATTVYLTDAVSGLGYGTQSYSGKAFYIDGQTFYVAVPGGTGSGANQTAKFFWGAGISNTNPVTPGTYQTVFPLVKLQGGEYFSLTSATAVYDPEVRVNSSATVYYPKLFELPTGILNITKVVGGPGGILLNGVNATLNADVNYAAVTVGAVTYNVTFNVSAYVIAGVSTIKLANTYYATTPDTNNPNRVGVLVLEQQNNATVKNAVILSISKDSSSYVIVSAPKFSGLTYPVSGVTLESDTTVTEYLDDYGTFTWHDSESQGLAKVYYPGAQAIATVAIGPEPQFSVAAGAGTVQSAVKITSPVAKLASEVTTTSLASDLILVGGPCVNTLVAQLLGSDEQCSNWAHTTGIIKEVSNAFSSGHKALIVAGTLGTDTRALAAKVMQGTLSFSQ